MTPWLTVDQVAEITGYSRDTIRGAIRDGHLRASKPSGTQQWRVLHEDLAGWFQGGVLGPAAAPAAAPAPQCRGRAGSVARLRAIERGEAA
jgi:excisionase family DNA binding protein